MTDERHPLSLHSCTTLAAYALGVNGVLVAHGAGVRVRAEIPGLTAGVGRGLPAAWFNGVRGHEGSWWRELSEWMQKVWLGCKFCIGVYSAEVQHGGELSTLVVDINLGR